MSGGEATCNEWLGSYFTMSGKTHAKWEDTCKEWEVICCTFKGLLKIRSREKVQIYCSFCGIGIKNLTVNENSEVTGESINVGDNNDSNDADLVVTWEGSQMQ